MLWKKINKIPFNNVSDCLNHLKKKTICSEWILDIFKKKKHISYKKYRNIEIHRINL